MESGRQIVESGINQLNDLITTLQNGGEVTEEDLNNVITTISQADAALAGVDGMDAAAYQGQAQQLAAALSSQVSAASDGMSQAAAGLNTIAGALNDGVTTLNGAAAQLRGGAGTLQNGASSLSCLLYTSDAADE